MNQFKVFGALLIVTAIGLFAGAKVVDQHNATQVRQTVSSQTYLETFTNSAGAIEQKSARATNITAPKDRTLFLQEEVTQASVDNLIANLSELNKTKGEIFLLIDSPGGSVLDGARFIDAMEASKNPVNTVCVGMCASMAAMIHGHGAQRYAHKHALLMYHPATGGVQGQVPNMLSRLNAIQSYTDKMDASIIARSKMKVEDFKRLVAYEIWVDGEQALDRGLIDKIVYLNAELPKKPAFIFSQPDEKRDGSAHPRVPVWPTKIPATKWFDVQMETVDCAALAKELEAEKTREITDINRKLAAFCENYATNEAVKAQCLQRVSEQLQQLSKAFDSAIIEELKKQGCK